MRLAMAGLMSGGRLRPFVLALAIATQVATMTAPAPSAAQATDKQDKAAARAEAARADAARKLEQSKERLGEAERRAQSLQTEVRNSREEQASNANGYYVRSERRIWVSPELSPLMSAKTLAHELSHHFADHEVNGHCREEAETIAEASAFIVLNHLGFDSAAIPDFGRREPPQKP